MQRIGNSWKSCEVLQLKVNYDKIEDPPHGGIDVEERFVDAYTKTRIEGKWFKIFFHKIVKISDEYYVT